MLRGMTTISLWADDVKAARDWYNEVLDTTPYFERPDADHPAYVEYRIGDYQHELGIIDRRYGGPAATDGPSGVVTYWHVDDIHAAHARLLAMGATEYQPITPREAGFITAAVRDPFGNVLGIMYNPHYLKVLDDLASGD